MDGIDGVEDFGGMEGNSRSMAEMGWMIVISYLRTVFVSNTF